jgi:hypothetical protein
MNKSMMLDVVCLSGSVGAKEKRQTLAGVHTNASALQ